MSSNIYLIAEIGINHNGDLDIAKKLIKKSKEAGFDAVKFQKRDLESVYSKEYLDSPRESPWGKTQRDQKKGLEFEKKEYDEIDKYCKELSIDWSASAWDLKSQKFLQNYDLKFNKIASPMLTNLELLKLVSSEKKKTFISTGMSTMEEIDKAVNVFKDNNCPFELMHCNSTYPMKEEDANLLCIKMLKDKYDCHVGYSGHESSLLKVCISAVVLGATSIERHITLDRAMYGSDQAASIEADVLVNFCKAIRKIPLILGTGKKTVSEKEKVIKEKLRSLS
ncbi:N-acetylneuraminate synthase family protein [Candidatus Pelagibacter sp.]|uniref:N-acetylneuraminate synthase family protein n=1 Tax=Candidatus Pelagibacter sp. TaxID=2024849 RepID=UPI003F87D38D